MEIPPPYIFTFSGSNPRSRLTAYAWLANASLISNISIDFKSTPSLFASFSLENFGEYPINSASNPAIAYPSIFIFGVSPSSSSFSLDITTTAAAPSFKLDEFAAVTVPPFTKHGRSFASFSILCPSLGPSSVSNIVIFPLRSFNSTGRISSLNLPSLIALHAL